MCVHVATVTFTLRTSATVVLQKPRLPHIDGGVITIYSKATMKRLRDNVSHINTKSKGKVSISSIPGWFVTDMISFSFFFNFLGNEDPARGLLFFSFQNCGFFGHERRHTTEKKFRVFETT